MMGIGWSYSADIWNFGILVSFTLLFYVRSANGERHGYSKRTPNYSQIFLTPMKSIILEDTLER